MESRSQGTWTYGEVLWMVWTVLMRFPNMFRHQNRFVGCRLTAEMPMPEWLPLKLRPLLPYRCGGFDAESASFDG